MAKNFKYIECEPFRAWNRLEPRTRQDDFDRALRTGIHDPMWMLARQWQFGEFKGEDTGSAILAKVQVETTSLSRFQAGKANTAVVFNNGEPLERTVEASNISVGYTERVQAGQYFQKLLDHHGQLHNGPTPYDKTAYKTLLLQKFPITIPKTESTDTQEIHLQKAKLLANRPLMQYLKVFAGKAIDGAQLYSFLKTDFMLNLSSFVLEGEHFPFLHTVANAYLQWYKKRYRTAQESKENSWNAKQLEYQFSCALPERASDNTVLYAEEYYTGHLDWYAFDIDKQAAVNASLLDPTANEQTTKLLQHTFSLIPTPAMYSGMPNNRWWEFEDGKVDLGNISAETTDIAKIVVTEYALIYGNDWFVIPCTLPIGSLSTITGIIITDTFGQKTLVQAAVQGQTDDWSGWGLFNLTSRKDDSTEEVVADTRLFLPPSLIKTQESEPIEQVLFLRDEIANMVWAIENTVHNLLGKGVDGHHLAKELHQYLHGVAPPALAAAEEAVLKYVLSNTVPENWIPFIPVHQDPDQRAVELQRASMPRTLDNRFTPIRPRTDLLRVGFEDKTAQQTIPYIHQDTDKQLVPYFIHEEEVPRSGIQVAGTFQRARWLHGEIIHWYGYKKQVGKGEGSSSLQFDKLEFLQNNKKESPN